LTFVLSRGAGAVVVYEPPLAPGNDPFTSPVDVSAASVGAVIPTPSPTASPDLSPSPSDTATAQASPTASPGQSPSDVPSIGSTEGGGFGGSGYTTVCDRELLIRSLEARPDAQIEWARVRGLARGEVADYIRSLKPVTLEEDVRVTNHAFQGGRAVAFQSILPAGSAVLAEADGDIVARCRCGNPLIEAEPIVKGTCKGCPAGYTSPAPLPAGKKPRATEVVNPPKVTGKASEPQPSPSPTAPAKPPKPKNLSLGAAASASATFSSDFPPRNGIDRSKATSWFSKGPEPEHGNTSTFTIALAKPSTITRIEFVDNSQNSDPAIASGAFGFRSWKIELLGRGGVVLETVRPADDPLTSQTLRVAAVAGVRRARFIGSEHQDPTCGGFGALWLFGYPTPVG
jgi:hypothetical protein